MELVPAEKQKVWRWPAVTNFTLGGAATGLYLLGSLIVSLKSSAIDGSGHFPFKLLAPLLSAAGFLVLAIEAGRPLRGYRLFRHINGSWISLEILAGAIFIPTALLDWLFPHPLAWILGVVAAMALIISQGFIVYCARAVRAWNVALIPVLFVTSGLATGGGLVLLLVALGELNITHVAVMIGLVCTVMNLGVWLVYLRRSLDGTFRESIRALGRPSALILIVGVGHLLPVLLLSPILLRPEVAMASEFLHPAVVLAGLAMVTGGVSQKAGIILKASHYREIMIEC